MPIRQYKQGITKYATGKTGFSDLRNQDTLSLSAYPTSISLAATTAY